MRDTASLRSILAADPQVTLRELPDGALQVTISASASTHRQLTLALLVCGLLGTSAGAYLVLRPPADLPFRNGGVLLLVLGCLNLALAPAMVLMRAVSGPPRDTVLELRRGSLKADRTYAGDHLVKTYGPGDLQHIFVEGGYLSAVTRIDYTRLSEFGRPETLRALAMLAAAYLWHDRELLTGTESISGIPHFYVAPARSPAPQA